MIALEDILNNTKEYIMRLTVITWTLAVWTLAVILSANNAIANSTVVWRQSGNIDTSPWVVYGEYNTENKVLRCTLGKNLAEANSNVTLNFLISADGKEVNEFHMNLYTESWDLSEYASMFEGYGSMQFVKNGNVANHVAMLYHVINKHEIMVKGLSPAFVQAFANMGGIAFTARFVDDVVFGSIKLINSKKAFSEISKCILELTARSKNR